MFEISRFSEAVLSPVGECAYSKSYISYRRTPCQRAAAGTACGPATMAQEPRPRLMIKQMVLENFKSYAGTQYVGPFHKVRPLCARRSAAPHGVARTR